MSPGKLASQAGHAFTNTILKAIFEDPYLAEQYERPGRIGTKVVLKAKSLIQLQRAYIDAQKAGVPCSLITDSGHVNPPFFDGSPIVTALGIGPARRDQVQFLRRYNLVL